VGFALGLDGGLGFDAGGAVGGDLGGDGVLEGFDAFARDCRDGEEGQLAAFGHGGQLFELVGIGDVALGGDDDGGPGDERGVEAAQLLGDDLEVGDGVGAGRAFSCAGVGDVDEVDDDAGALDVLEELDAQTCTQMRSFDEAGEVGDGEGFRVRKVADLDDAEVGFERGEGVVGDLGFGGGEARDERGFADVRVTDQTGVGEQAQFEAVVALFAGAAELVLARSLVGAGGEVLVAASAASAAGDDDGLAGAAEVVDQLAGVVVVEQRADGDFEGGVFAGLARAVGAFAVAAALRFVLGVKRKWTRVLWLSDEDMRMSPPWPPSPPEGPPRGTNFSRRKAMQPLPPSPALIRIRASSMNMRSVQCTGGILWGASW